MKVFGLTGSIGMGKSVVASMLRQKGIPVFDSDKAVHELLSPKGAAFTLVARHFPAAWNTKKHVIDRQKLGQIVFADTIARKRLESILHPLITQMQFRFMLKGRRMGLKRLALDIPLLFETGGERKCDAVLCVTSPHFIQRLRVLRRPGMTDSRFQSILAQQWPDRTKRRLADAVLPTGLGRAATLQQLNKILSRWKGSDNA